MSRYSVMHTVYGSTVTQVEADSIEQAIELAGLNADYSVCHQCANNVEVGDLGDAVQVINLDTNECFSINEAGEVETE